MKETFMHFADKPRSPGHPCTQDVLERVAAHATLVHGEPVSIWQVERIIIGAYLRDRKLDTALDVLTLAQELYPADDWTRCQ